jgi:hypothetical protein
MTPEGRMTRDDFRDAIGWMYAVFSGDAAAKNGLANACDPAGLVEAMATMYGGLIAISTNGKPHTYLDFVRDHLDEMLDADGVTE